jgi:hypothetical protein
MIEITERGMRDSCLGAVLQLKICTRDYQQLSWREIWEAFTAAYPGRWAVQVFPPRERLLDAKHVYHLFVLPEEPRGLDLR